MMFQVWRWHRCHAPEVSGVKLSFVIMSGHERVGVFFVPKSGQKFVNLRAGRRTGSVESDERLADRIEGCAPVG